MVKVQYLEQDAGVLYKKTSSLENLQDGDFG